LSLYLLKRRRAFDVMHCHMAGFELIPAVCIARYTGQPVIVKIAASGAEGDVARLRSGDAPWGVLGPVAGGLLGQVNAIVAPSKRIARELTEQGYTNHCHIPNGVDVDRFHPACETDRVALRQRLQLPSDRRLVGFLGRLHRHKGIDVLIRAWAASRLPAAGAVLCLAGEGPEDVSLRRLADATGAVRGSINFVGRVEPSEFLRTLDACVLPSRAEGMSNALLEGMASGLACVGTRVSGTEDALQHGSSGLVTPPDEVGPLTAALNELLNRELRVRLGRAARLRAEAEYSLGSVAHRYEDLYRLLISTPDALRSTH
jgi:glycosyltransferase involved in cell wall biosynthesis